MPEGSGASERQEAVLRTDRLTRVVEGRALVDDVTLSVERGEVVAIVGSSGSGKTSLLRLLNRLDEPTGGTVFYEEQDYREIPPRELRRRAGMLLQQPYLFPGTVAANLAYGPASHGESLPEDVISDFLRQVGLAGYGDRDVSRLSGGEAQRVSLARTLANGPEVLLLDEPTSALDESSQLGVEELLCRIIGERQLTCLIVTHDRAQAMRMAGRAVVLEAGRIVDSVPTSEMKHAR
jgi:putative ABC transport system ATP-binding protein